MPDPPERRFLIDLRDQIGSEELQRLVPIFEADITDTIAGLEASIDRSDFVSARRVAHKAAGTLAQYGFRDLSHTALAIEAMPDVLLPDAGRALVVSFRGAIVSFRELIASIASS